MKKLLPIILLFFFQSVGAQDFRLEKLADFINSMYDEITPVPTRDGKTLFFTRVGHPEFEQTLYINGIEQSQVLTLDGYLNKLSSIYSEMAGTSIYNPVRSSFNQDIWSVNIEDSTFTTLTHYKYPMNNALPNSLVAITPDPNAFYVINQFDSIGNMERGFSIARRITDSTWSIPKPIEIQDFYTITSDVSLTMSFDGQILILSATRFDSKDMDLYVCFRERENYWSAPQHLGSSVNSSMRETAPFLSEDNTTLFFSSNRSGNSDIYICRRLDETWKNWSAPYRAVEPINSESDDGQPYFNMTSGYLYFSSKRDGNSDIFRIQIAPPQPTEITIIGRVINEKTKKTILNAQVRYGMEGTNATNTIEAVDGAFRLKIPKGVKFYLRPEKMGFVGKTEEVLFRRDYYYFDEHYLDLPMTSLEVNDKIELETILFQQSKDIILEESYSALEKLIDTMKEMPSLHIRIEGHTDNVGKVEDLLHLSEQRAQAVKTYLVNKGIDSKRIETIGYGDKFSLNDNSTENLRALNRRVEFIIIKI